MVLVVTANEENASNKKMVALFVFHIRGKQDLQKRVSHKNKSVPFFKAQKCKKW